ncbi:MAG: Ig-like domain-containing protein [bacterium]
MKIKPSRFLITLLIGFLMVTCGCFDKDDDKDDDNNTPPPVTLTSIDVTPANSTISQGATQQYTAMGNYADGSTGNITGQVTWASSDTAIATITAAGGLATATAPGQTSITASLSGITSTAKTLTVNLSTNILMGKVISSPNDLAADFDAAVQAIKTAVGQFSFTPDGSTTPVNPWKVVEEQSMPFPAGRHGLLLEICAPMFADDAMAMGQYHALGMPCKIGIWTEDSDEDGEDDLIKINSFDESALFGFFFADAVNAPTFGQFAALIRSHTRSIVQSAITALGGVWLYEYQAPFFTKAELEQTAQAWKTDAKGYADPNHGYGIQFEVSLPPDSLNLGSDDPNSPGNFLSKVKQKIVSAIGTTPYSREDWEVIDPNFKIPVKDYQDPNYAKIAEIKIHSPYYARQIVDLGGKYIVALPYAISVWLNDLAQDGTRQDPDRVIVGVLNPEYVLKNFLKDEPENVRSRMLGTAIEMKNQILAMVNNGLKEYTLIGTRPQPRISTGVLMGKIPISSGTLEADAFDAAVLAVKTAVAGYVPQGTTVPPWKVPEEKDMPLAGGRKGKLVEICAPGYAAMAMAMGQHHALGLPCKIGIWTEDEDGDTFGDVVKINRFDEPALFNFFFADVMSDPNFGPFAAMISSQTKEIVKIAITSLGGEWIFEHHSPFFTQAEMQAVQAWKNDTKGYADPNRGYGIVYEVPLPAGSLNLALDDPNSPRNFLAKIKNSIISAADDTSIPNVQDDWQVIDPNFNIPVGDLAHTFASVGEIKLCSHQYSEQVVALGGKYMIAFPCTISVWLNDLAQDGSHQDPDKVIVSILNPEFILKNHFKDQPSTVLQSMAPMGGVIAGELKAIVDKGLENFSGVVSPAE